MSTIHRFISPPHKPSVYTPHWNSIWTSLNYLWHRTGNSFSKSIQAAVGYGGTISWVWRPKQIGGKCWKKKGRQWYDFQRLSQIDDFQIHQGVSSRKNWCSRFEPLVCFRRIFLCGGTFFQTWPRMVPHLMDFVGALVGEMSEVMIFWHFFCLDFSWISDFIKIMGIDLMVPFQGHLGTKKHGLIKELSTTNCPFLSGLNKALFPGAWGGWAPWIAVRSWPSWLLPPCYAWKLLEASVFFWPEKNQLDHRISRWVLEIPQKTSWKPRGSTTVTS